MEQKKLTVAVIFGGVSSEHEVSLRSAAFIMRSLDASRYDALYLGITRQGKWYLYSGSIDSISDGTWVQNTDALTPAVLSPDRGTHGILALDAQGTRTVQVDVAFPMLHGKNGEDGTLQGLLALSGIPFVGSHTLSSAVCMDKAITHTILSSNNFEQAHYLWFYADRYADEQGRETIRKKVAARLNFPVFVKPSNAGSSVGISKVSSMDQLDEAVFKAAKEDCKVVVEEGIVGQEVECAVMGNRDAVASVIGEIGASAEFYDYDDKYNSGTSVLYIPARIDEEKAEEVRRTAVRAYRLLGCSGLTRVDFFVTKSGRVIINELNTLPGFTAISMYPKLWQAAGMDGTALVTKLIEYALCAEY